jgi:5-methylcytosine-specific restriction protein B
MFGIEENASKKVGKYNMDKNLDFLTKQLVDEAVIVIDKNGIPPKRGGRGYAVSIGKEQYPFKLIITEAAKISGINLTSNDFSSIEANRKGFQKLTGYPIIVLGVESEYIKFKKLLEYFVAHLEWLIEEDINNRGYNEFIRPLIKNNTFKRTGQGYANAKIQQQINDWEQYKNGKICINIQPNFGSYKSSKNYLNWLGTGINIIANWDGNRIISLYQEEYLYWEDNPRRIRFGNEVSIENLDLFSKEIHVSETLIEFYETFNAAIIRYNKFEKLKKMILVKDTSVNLLNYKKQIILQGPPGTGKTKSAKDIAVEMLGLRNVNDLNNNDQFKLIQFHPSYTYEDFVRGIVSIPNEDGEGVLFKTENKILAEFAEKALKNKLDSQKGATELSKEKWLNEQFEKFIDFISDEIEKNGKVELTESVFIIGLDNDAFRYKGIQGWTEKGTRMLFKDIKQAFLDNNTIRQELKHNQNVSRSAYWDATYFIKTVELFRKFLTDENIKFAVNSNEIEPLKNYVLIIDEINRANLPSVLGELIYALEYRDEAVESMYEFEGKREIILPSNLYIIGTMNTADRSVGHIDYAIKRRFAFVDVLPTHQAIDDVVTDLDLNTKAKELYHKVAELFNEDKSKNVYLQSDFKAKDVQLGHSYFLVETENELELKLKFEIKPLLNEYVKDGILCEDAILEINNLWYQ